MPRVTKVARLDIPTVADEIEDAESVVYDIETLQKQVRDLEVKFNELTYAYNLTTKYLMEHRKAFDVLIRQPWYRFIWWVWPFPLPPFERKTIMPLVVRDRQPK